MKRKLDDKSRHVLEQFIGKPLNDQSEGFATVRDQNKPDLYVEICPADSMCVDFLLPVGGITFSKRVLRSKRPPFFAKWFRVFFAKAGADHS